AAAGRSPLLGDVRDHGRGRLRGGPVDRAGGDPAGRGRADPRDRDRYPGPARDPHEHRGMDLLIHPEALPEPVWGQAAQDRQRGVRGPRSRRDRRHPPGAAPAVPVLPLHHARAGHARRRPEPGLEPALWHPGGLDAGARLGSGRGLRGRRRDDGRPGCVPRSQHDGRHPDLRVRRGHRRRLHEPARGGGRGDPGGRDRESGRDLRLVHRHRAEAHCRAGHDHHRAAGEAERPVRPYDGSPRVGMASPGNGTATEAAEARASAAPAFPAAAQPGSGRLRLVGPLVVLAVALVLPEFVSGFRLVQFTQVLIYAIALLGLNLLTGYNGQFSLGHGAFYGIGAYTTAIMIDRWSIGYGWTILAAGIVCLIIGFLFGRPALRLEGLYLAL